MLSTKVKAVIIIAIIASGTVALLLAPILPITYAGDNLVDFDASVQQIDLIANIEDSDIRIQYDASPTAPLFNMTYTYILRHAIIVPSPTVTITLVNNTAGNILTVQLTVDFPTLFVNAGAASMTYLTINPNIISNLSVYAGSGNIGLHTENYLNKTFVDIDCSADSGTIFIDLESDCIVTEDIDLRVGSGNVDADVASGCTIDDFLAYVGSGNINFDIGANCEIIDRLSANTSSGNVVATLLNGTSIHDDIYFRSSSGNVNVDLINLTLNNQEVICRILSSSGTVDADVWQLIDPLGNLTLDMDASSGNAQLYMRLDNNTVSSRIEPATSSGTVFYGLYLGYNRNVDDLESKNMGLSSNFDADIDVGSGNVILDVALI